MRLVLLRVVSVLLACLLAGGCGRIGLDYLPDGDGDSRAGRGGDPPAGAQDGGANDDAGRDGGPSDAGDSGVDPSWPGTTDTCALDVCVSDVDQCPSDGAKLRPGVCGCGVSDVADADGDGTADCNDLCEGEPDRLADGSCGCTAAEADDDGDGIPSCNDACPEDADKTAPALCGCGIADDDSDGDGLPDCADGCADDGEKVEPGRCGCGVVERDDDDDGTPDCAGACNGVDDASYVPDATCGAGYCRTTNTPSSCEDGVETACAPGAPLAADDATCDGVDDDCSGDADEGVPSTPSTCGVGVCAATGSVSCISGVLTDSCTAGSPASTVDGPTANGLDDDCDGPVDEDACPTAPVLFETAGRHDIAVPVGCTSATVQLWGGGGASGDSSGGYWGGSVTGGRGGAGGFAQDTFAVTGATVITLRIGQGGRGCGGAGVNENASYSGGAGATSRSGNGANGADGSEAGGGGANPSSGGDGGDGFFGGGGGGGGGGLAWNPFGNAGGGGAASVLFVDAMRLLAGGGGGGGGAGSTPISSGVSGGAGGSGCGANGASAGNDGGGGGGGGKCSGTVMQQGSGRTPHVPNGVTLPAGTATGGNTNNDCLAGGDGYAIVQWSR